jgi:DDE superfamily endonuclease/Transposase
MPPGRELHPTERARILELHSTGLGAKRIYSLHLEWNLGTIKYTIRMSQRRGQLCASLPRSGRPRILTAEDRDFVYDTVVHQNPDITMPDLLAKVDYKVKKRSLQYLLREIGRRKWIKMKRPALTEEQAAARLAWARQYQHLRQPEQWRHIKWTDESTVERGQGARPCWTFERPSEQIRTKNITPVRASGKGVKQMFWAGFGYNIRTPLITMMGDPEAARGGVTARRVVEAFDGNLRNLLRPGDIFMLDNARVHTARRTRNFLHLLQQEIPFTIMDWPPYSPDLNPIENIWKLLKQGIYDKYPELQTAPDTEETRLFIIRAAQEVWGELQVEILNNLSDTMPHRVDALIDADGWYTSY